VQKMPKTWQILRRGLFELALAAEDGT
jgi:hypothetical protein